MNVWFARHGEVDASGICYGHWDPSVVHAPEHDAAVLVQAWRASVAGAPDAIWSSPSPRCLAVAECAAKYLHVAQVSVDPRLRELHFGEWEGQAWSAIERDDAARMHAWMEHWQHAAPPGGETLQQLEARLRGWSADIHNAAAKCVQVTPYVALVVGHAGPMRVLRAQRPGASMAEEFARKVAHLTPERLEVFGN
jgi:alpha-ribazole phosphatase